MGIEIDEEMRRIVLCIQYSDYGVIPSEKS